LYLCRMPGELLVDVFSFALVSLFVPN
jgi:hypothetical protein